MKIGDTYCLGGLPLTGTAAQRVPVQVTKSGQLTCIRCVIGPPDTYTHQALHKPIKSVGQLGARAEMSTQRTVREQSLMLMNLNVNLLY